MRKLCALTVILLSMITVNKIDIYPETAIITEIKDDVVTAECFNGNQFQFIGAEDYMVNDVVSMLMYGNNTDIITDDIILKVKYSG